MVLEVSGVLEFSGEELGFSGGTVGSDSGREDGLVVMLLSGGLWAELCWLGCGE